MLARRLRILLAQDTAFDADPFLGELRHLGYAPLCARAETVHALKARIAAEQWDVVLAGSPFCGLSSTDFLALLRVRCPSVPVIVLSDDPSPTAILAAMRAGARDYLSSEDTGGMAAAIDREVSRSVWTAATEAAGRDSGRAEVRAPSPRLPMADDMLHTLSRAMEQSPVCVAIADPTGTIEYANPSFCKLTGYSAAELNGQSLRALTSGHTSPDDRTGAWRTVAAGGTWTGTLAGEKKNGEVYWEQAVISPVREQSGAVTRCIAVVEDITERLQAQAVLRESERKYRLLAENATDIISRLAPDGRILFVSAACMPTLGFAPDKLVGRFPHELAHPDDVKALEGLHQIILSLRDVQTVTRRVRHKNGHYVWLQTTARGIVDAATGAIVELQTASRDVTAQRAVDREREWLSAIVASFPDAIASWSPSGHIESWNEGAERLYGYTAAEAIGLHASTFVPPELQAETEARRARVLQGERVSQLETVRQHKSGRHIEVLATLAPIRDAHGEIVGVASVTHDITKRKQAEAALRESEYLLQTLLDAMPDHIYFKDRDSRIIRANKAQAAYLGFRDPAEEIGKTDFDFYPREFAQVLYDAEQQIIRTGQPQLGAVEDHSAFAHAPRWLQATKVPIMQGGHVTGLVGITRDVTDLKRAEEVLAHQAAAAEDLAQLRSSFVATVSHELRSPLTAIIGYAELLEAQWGRLQDAERLKMIHRIVGSANRQKRLVEDLLLLSRLELGGIVARTERVTLGSLVSRAAEEIRTSYPGQGIDLDGPANLMVMADPDRALEILLNLVDNAAKYSPEGSPIRVTWAREGASAVLWVRDFGGGVSEEGRRHLFTRFGRVPGSRMRAGRVGTGLGLYLARSFAQAMNGELDSASTGPGGSTFRLSLPVAKPAQPGER